MDTGAYLSCQRPTFIGERERGLEEVGTVPFAEKAFNREKAGITICAVGKMEVLVQNNNCNKKLGNGMGGVVPCPMSAFPVDSNDFANQFDVPPSLVTTSLDGTVRGIGS